MKTMEGILKQELIRLKETEKSYIREIAKLPRGTLQEKKIKGIVYLYLVASQNSKLSYRYLGGLSEAELRKLKEDIGQRKKFQSLLKETRRDIKHISRVLHGKK